jgi:hypothetical protein
MFYAIMSYGRAMGLGVFSATVFFVPRYIWLREKSVQAGMSAFGEAAIELLPWVAAWIVLDFIANIFRSQKEFPFDLLPSLIFVFYLGIPAILIYEWLGLKWFLIVVGGGVGLFILAAVILMLVVDKFDESKNQKPSGPPQVPGS